MLRLVLLAVLAGAPGAYAQPARAPAATEDLRPLAQQFLQKARMDKVIEGMMPAAREMAVAVLERERLQPQQAADLADSVLMPAIRARTPELLTRFENVLVDVFTAAELRAVLNDQSNAARRSAAGKASVLPERFRIEGEAWGQKVGADAMAENAALIRKLGIGEPGK